MVTVDLDTRVEEVEEAVCPHITSKFLCAPGCPTGGIACYTTQCTNGCSISVGCKWLVALSQQSALEVKYPRPYLQGRFLRKVGHASYIGN